MSWPSDMAPESPRVSVVMAAFNAAPFLRDAIDSILGQTFTDFEFIIVDDGSTDGTAEIIESYTDPRIRLIRNPGNLGLVASLNRGLAAARGEYIARMDADDESLSGRLEAQVRFLDTHPEIGLCGTHVQTFGARNEFWTFECDPKRLRCHLLFSTGISHPSVMFRRRLVEAHGLTYDPAYPRAQDYDLWVRFAGVTALANLPDVLLRYRLHENSLSGTDRSVQDALADEIRRRQLRMIGLEVSDREMFVHTTLMRGWPRTAEVLVDEAEAWLVRLLEANGRHRLVDQATLTEMLYEMWFKLCRGHRASLRMPAVRFLRSPIARAMPLLNRSADGARLLAMSRRRILEQPPADEAVEITPEAVGADRRADPARPSQHP